MHALAKRRVVDAHMHLYDGAENRYEHLEHVDAMFEALIGEYSSLPRPYLFDDYAATMNGLEIDGMVWHEFMSADAVREVEWAERLAERLSGFGRRARCADIRLTAVRDYPRLRT